MSNDFIHLKVQSSYSMLESALKIDNIIDLAQSLGMQAIGLTDRHNLFGSMEFAVGAIKKGIQPIHGAILNLKDSSLYSNSATRDSSIADNNHTGFSTITVLAKDQIGYQNLLKLVSYHYTKNFSKTRHITFEDLYEHHQGLIVISDYTEGLVGKLLISKKYPESRSVAKKLLNLFEDRLYLEISRHGRTDENILENEYINLAYELGIPLAATNKVLFSNKQAQEDHEILLCISQNARLNDSERPKSNNNYYFKSSNEMGTIFQDLDEAIINTSFIAKRCNFMLEPQKIILPNFGSNEEELLRTEAIDGLKNKLACLKIKQEQELEYFERLNYELDIICQMNFAGYFLIVADFINWSKRNGIAVGPGRGSGAGSMVAWSIGITNINPIEYGLLFERFLNPDRISMPDFDIDFCQERRHEVVNYVKSKYGEDKVAQIITFGKMQAKAVIKDVSRVLELPYKYADHLSNLIPFSAVNPVTLGEAIEQVPELHNASFGLGLYLHRSEQLEGEEQSHINQLVKRVLSCSLRLEGLHRHASVHAAGIIIAGKPLLDVVPLYKDNIDDMIVIQYSLKYAEMAGLVKFDFLGLQTLTILSKCCTLINSKNPSFPSNPDNIPFGDKRTFEMLSKGEGIGIFQFESIGMRTSLKNLKPENTEDLMALTALYRPGPLDNLPVYISCKHGKTKPQYLDQSLIDLLQETYGVIIYQEQVMGIAKIIAGYSLASADVLRWAMGKKIKSEMQRQESQFIEGAKKNNISYPKAKEIFDTIAKFASYGFNKSHAAAYAVISYCTAYLKANYPMYFFITLLNLDIEDHYKINLFLNEAKKYRIAIIAPDINLSEAYFSNLDHSENIQETIIFGLAAIKGISINIAQSIARERQERGKYSSIADFITRNIHNGFNKKTFESLIKSGALDTMHSNRAELFLSIEKFLDHIQNHKQASYTNQLSLFQDDNQSLIIKAPDWDNIEKGTHEFLYNGFFSLHNPLTEYQDLLKENNIRGLKDLLDITFGTQTVRIAGVLQNKVTRISPKGQYITLQLSDLDGIFEATIFDSEVIKNYGTLLQIPKILILDCNVYKTDSDLKLIIRAIKEISLLSKNNHVLTLLASDHSKLMEILSFLKTKTSPEPNVEIRLIIQIDELFCANLLIPSIFNLSIQEMKNLESKYQF